MGRLEGKVAIITGGASGIGLAIATGYVNEGARVYIGDISQARCDAAAKTLGERAIGHELDVRDPVSIERLVERAAQDGGIDILVNCAGVVSMQPLVEITPTEFDRVFSVNTRGILFMIQAVARRMIAQRRGDAIINIASGGARRPAPGAMVYCASKAAVVSITQCAALELVKHGIRVNAIAPGSVRTPMWSEVERLFAAASNRNEEMSLNGSVVTSETGGPAAAAAAATPAGRLSTPDEYAGAAIFLASRESSYVLGQTLNVDGGLYLN